jgi:thiol-disulfide isomerase/thioredoxin
MKKIVLFKSPTCGPCKLFAPVLKGVAEKVGAEYVEIDVTSEEGFKYAEANGITHSGVAWYEENGDVKVKWERPAPEAKLLSDLQ